MTASELITTAIQRSFGMVGQQKVSKAALLAELSSQDALIVQMFAQNAPDLLAHVDGSETVSLASNQSGYTLSSGFHYRDFTHVDPTDNDYTPITLVRRDSQDAPPRNPAGVLATGAAAGVFYPIDPQGERWQSSGSRSWFEVGEGHEIHYSYVPAATALTSLTSTLTSPDFAREALIASLILAILLSNPQTPADKLQIAMARRGETLQSVLMLAYKFGHPAGTRRGFGDSQTDADWVSDQVGN
jgi:hypothetical protein